MSEADLQPAEFDLDRDDLGLDDDLGIPKHKNIDELYSSVSGEPKENKRGQEKEEDIHENDPDIESKEEVLANRIAEVRDHFGGREMRETGTFEEIYEKNSDGSWNVYNQEGEKTEWKKDDQGNWTTTDEEGQVVPVSGGPEQMLKELEGGKNWINDKTGEATSQALFSKDFGEAGSMLYTVKSVCFEVAIYENDEEENYPEVESLSPSYAPDILATPDVITEENPAEVHVAAAVAIEQGVSQEQQQEQQTDVWSEIFGFNENVVPNPLIEPIQKVQDTVQQDQIVVQQESMSEVTVSEGMPHSAPEMGFEPITVKNVDISAAGKELIEPTKDKIQEASSELTTISISKILEKQDSVSQEDVKSKNDASPVKQKIEKAVGIIVSEKIEITNSDIPSTPDSPLPSSPIEQNFEGRGAEPTVAPQGRRLEVIKPEVQERIHEILQTEPVVDSVPVSVHETHEFAAMFPIEVKMETCEPVQGLTEEKTINEIIVSLQISPTATEITIIGEKNFQEQPKDVTVFRKEESGEISYSFYEVTLSQQVEVMNENWEFLPDGKQIEKSETIVVEEQEKDLISGSSKTKDIELRDQQSGEVDQLRVVNKEVVEVEQSEKNSPEKLILRLSSIPADALEEDDDQQSLQPRSSAQETFYQSAI